MYPHIISYLLRTIRTLYNESTYEIMTYMPVSPNDSRHGQHALRSVQELLPIQDRERHEMVDVALDQVEHQSRIGGILNI